MVIAAAATDHSRSVSIEIGRANAFTADQPAVVVDLSRPAPLPLPGNGFLLDVGTIRWAMNDSGFASLMSLVEPTYWRVADPVEARLVAGIGVHPDLLLMETYRQRAGIEMPYAYRDPDAYERWLRDLARANPDTTWVWEVWNEWYSETFWRGSEAEAFDLYRRAEHVLRSELGPGVKVAGPSISRFDRDRMRTFAEYCLAHGCQINVLTWHELAAGGAGTIADHVRWARDSLVLAPRFAALRIQQIHLNEIVAKAERYSTSDLVVALANLAGVDAFARSCWQEYSSRRYECLTPSFDGIVDSATSLPRAAWWVHAAYAAIRHAPAKVQVQGGVAAVAGRIYSHPATALALIAADSSASGDSVRLRLEHVPGGVLVRLVVRRIPWAGLDEPVGSLPIIAERPVGRDTASLEITLPLGHRSRITTIAADVVTGGDALLISVEPSTMGSGRYWPLGPLVRRTRGRPSGM